MVRYYTEVQTFTVLQPASPVWGTQIRLKTSRSYICGLCLIYLFLSIFLSDKVVKHLAARVDVTVFSARVKTHVLSYAFVARLAVQQKEVYSKQ